jgi:hypothetical protein
MPGFNGSGTFVRTHNWISDRDADIKITAVRHDAEDDAFATGLTATICRNGESTTTASIPFAQGIGIASTKAISFASGDVTITHGTNALTLAGATSGYTFSDGAISVTAGQIVFPAAQNAAADVNTLDDYEEGTTTPTVTATVGTFTSVSASLAYTKVGRVVSFSATISITTAGTAAGQMVLPLPFTAATSSACCGIENAVTGVGVLGLITGAGSAANIVKYDSTTIIADGRFINVEGSFRI